MSKLLGVIKAIIGQVYVVDANGAQRQVHEGDRVYSGEEIVTGVSGAVSISLPDGKTLDIGRNSHWGEHGLRASHNQDSSAQDIAAAQKAIADGADPTQVLEATAAGNEAPVTLEGGGGGHTLVQLELTGQVVDPTAGFNTKGLGSPNWDINLPIGGIDAGSASVFPPEVQITEFAGNDGFINKNEFHQTHLSGTSNQNHITLTFTDSQKNTFTVTVPVSNGHWNIETDLGGLVPGNVTVVAIATDVTGRTAESVDHALIDITGPNISISVENVTPDNLINYEESRQPQTLIHGVVGGDAKPGDIVTLLVDGNEYTSVVTDPGNGTLTYTIPVLTQGLLNDPSIHATLTSTDDAGNTTIVSTDHHVDNDLYAQNAVTIETVANDDVVNANEFRMPTIISGVASGDAKAGDPVTLTIQGKAFHGTVFDDHGQLRYEIVVPSATLKEGANDVVVTLVSHDAAGNEVTAIAHRTITLDTQAHNSLTINDVDGDNTLNRSELYTRNQVISGTVSGEDAKAGDPVLVEINGHQYRGEVIDLGNNALGYRITVDTSDFANNSVPIDGNVDVKVTVTSHDAAGNQAIATDTHSVHIDNLATNQVNIGVVATDDVVNAHEFHMPTLISGVASGDAKAGDAVVISVQGLKFAGTVVDDNGQMRYEVALPKGALLEGKNDVVVTLVSHDAAGNEVTALEHRTVTLDTQAHNSLTINDVDGDNTLNRSEPYTRNQVISGTVSGEDAKAGDPVLVEINGHQYRGEVIDLGNNALGYRIAVNTSDFAGNSLNVDASVDVKVTVTSHDAAGNMAIATDTHSVHLDNVAQNAVTVETVAHDDVVNAIENSMPTLISGVAGGDAKAGDAVVISVQGLKFAGTVVDDNGQMRYEVALPKGALLEGKNDVVVTLVSHDAAGNEVTALEHRTVTLDTQAHNSLTINDVDGDNTLNRSELYTRNQVISGTVSGEDAKAGDPVLVEINGHQYRGEVIDLGNNALGYRITVDTSDFANNSVPIDGNVDMKVTVTSYDAAGNLAIATDTHSVHIDNLATNQVNIGAVATDDVVNVIENRMPTLISGVAGGDAKAGDAVVISVQGLKFAGTVVDDNGQMCYEVALPKGTLLEGKNDVVVTLVSHDAAGNEVTAIAHRTITLDTQAHNSLTINDVDGDNTLNRSELYTRNQVISGTVSGEDAKAGDPVLVEINGHQYRGEVIDLGNNALGYRITVDTSDFANNSVPIDGNVDVKVTVTSHDAAGNLAIATDTHSVHLDNLATNQVNIGAVATDDVVNAIENSMPTLISGVAGGDAKAGDAVVISVQGLKFAGTVVDDNGQMRYEVALPKGTLLEGKNDVVVTLVSHDAAGNEVTALEHRTVTLDTQAHNAQTIDNVTDDNTLNRAELYMRNQVISGTVSGEDAKAGDPVLVEINGHQYHGQVVDLGNNTLGYRIAVNTSDFAGNSLNVDASVDVKVTVTSHDAAGNLAIATDTHSVHLDNYAENSVHIDAVAGDNVININEFSANGGITQITGTVSGADAKAGDIVTLELKGGTVIQGVVLALVGGGLGYSFPVNTHMMMTHPEMTVSVTSRDAAGNSITNHATLTVSSDMYTQSHITIDGVTADNVINIKESTDNHGKTTISGSVSGDAKAHNTVELVINGQHYSGEVVTLANGGLGYSIPVNTRDLVNDPVIHASIHTRDDHGNETTATADRRVGVDLHADSTIGIDTVAGDDIISKVESDQHIATITGPVGGDAKPGDDVTLTFNGKTYSGTVIELPDHSLGYRIEVSTDKLPDGSDQKVHVSISTVDDHGNPYTATHDQIVHIDLHAEASITVDKVTSDNVLNHSELNMAQQIITGTVGGDAKVDDVVTLEINGRIYTGKVIALGNNQLGYHIPVDSSAFSNNQGNQDKNVNVRATVTSHDAVGNEVITPIDRDVHIDNHARASITLDTVAGDNMINGAESVKPTTEVMGTVSGDVKVGDKVEVTVNGTTYETTVQRLPEHNGAKGYKLDVPTSDLVADPHITAHITGVDTADNTQDGQADKDLQVDLKADATLTIDLVTSDNTINGAESLQQFTLVTGTVGGDVHVNDTVYLTVNGHVLTGKVFAQGNGDLVYSIKVSTADLLADPHLTATVSTTDAAGNPATANAQATVNIDTRVVAAITVDDVTLDNTLNYAEQHQPHTLVSGTVSGEVKPGDPLLMKINGHIYHGVVDDLGGNKMGYHISVDTTDLLASPHIEVSMDVTDGAQNHAQFVAHHNVSLDDSAAATITLERVTGDDVLNGVELQAPKTTISGTVGGDARINDVVHLNIGGHLVDAKVIPLPHLGGALGYSIDVDTQWLQNDPHITATITTTDPHDNTATAEAKSTLTIDDSAVASVHIDPLVTDDHDAVINGKEAHNPLTTVTGSVGGDVQVGDLVTLTINNQTYYAQVRDDHGQHVFSTEVSTLDLLMDPNIQAKVSATDAAGNVANGQDSLPVVIDTVADAGITIDTASSGLVPGQTVANDLQPGWRPDFISVTGHVDPDAVFGDTVTITVGHGVVITTQVTKLPDGKLGYQANISSDKFDNDGNIVVSITTHDNHGNTATAAEHKFINLPWMHHMAVIGNTPYGFGTPPVVTTPTTGTGTTQPPQPHVHLTVDKVAGDDILNQQEAQKNTTPIRGLVSGDAHVGDDVIVTINNIPYHGKAIAIAGLLGYQVNVPTDVLTAHPTFDVSITVHNSAGSDTAKETKTIAVDTDNPVHITMDKIAGDDVINGQEAKTGVTTVRGTVSGDGIHDGSVVTLQVNGNTLTAVVHADHGQWVWSQDVSINDLRSNPDIVATVAASDAAGNPGTDSTNRHVDVDLKADASVSIDKITADNVLNAQETLQPTIAVSGTVSGDVHPGESVTLMVNGQTYTAVIDANNHYVVDVNTADLLADRSIDASVTGHDVHGNVQDATFTQTFAVDTTATGTVTINTVGGDNTLNADEVKAGKVEISGTVSGDVHKGDTVQITVNGVTVDATVIELPHMNGQLGYKQFVSTTDLQADPTIHVSVTGHDAAGNSHTAVNDKTVTIDTHADATLVLDPVSGDDVLNKVEAEKATTTITGHVTGDVEVGDQVTVTVNGKELVAKVRASGSDKVFSVEASTVDLVHDQHITARVVAHDDAGNRQQIDTDKTITVDRLASGTVGIDDVSADNILNHQELSGPNVTITGLVGGDALVNDPITLTIGGHTFHGNVIKLNSGDLGYQIAVDSATLRANTSIKVELTGHDAPGNSFTAQSTHTYSVDEHANGAITINDRIAGDNTVNLQESQSDTLIRFTVFGDAHPTDVVTVSINGHDAVATLIPGTSRDYQIAVPGTYLHEGNNNVEVKTTLHDDAGNTLEVTNHKNVVLDTHTDASIVVDKITGDNHISAAESQSGIMHITGSVTGDVHAGDHINALVNGHDHDVVVYLDNNELRYDIAANVSEFHGGHNRVMVSIEAHDNHGNVALYGQQVDVMMDDPLSHKGHTADKGQHAAFQQALHNLFDDSTLSLPYAPAATAHGQTAGALSANDKAQSILAKVDLSDLARELHEGVDIAKYIQSGGDHQFIASPAKVAHGMALALSTPVSGDLHSPSYSLDHLIAKPEQNHNH